MSPDVWRLIATRLGSLVATLLVASIAIYGALFLAPGNPATLLAGGHATPALLRAIDRREHLNEPFLARYWHWLVGLLHGNLGQSFLYRESVTTLLAGRVENTVFLVVYAATLIIVGGVVLGLLAALFRRTGAVITVATSVGLATPSFVAAIILITVFAVDLKWFPVFGAGSGFVDQLRHLTLPALALSLSWLAYTAQLTKAAVTAELAREHVETARSRGIRDRHVVTRHVLRNAMIPITTVSGLTIAGLIAGDVVVEQAFGINGLGSFLVQSALQKDFASVQAVSLLLVTAFVVINSAVDLWSLALDPRLRAGTQR
ncbi:MAG TPA: ABC transporter permease [Acidimicrobiales bacterium]|nr:ABC transporter permease [Acidimicrobiales bacterium]